MSRLCYLLRLFQQRGFHKCLNAFQYKDNKYYRTLSKRKHVLSHQVVKQAPFDLNGRLSVGNRTLASQSHGKPCSSFSYVCGICNRQTDPQNILKSLLHCPTLEKTIGVISVRGYSSPASGVSFELLQKYLDTLNDEYVELQNKSHIGKSEGRRKKSLQSMMELREDFLQKLKDYTTLTTLISGLGPEDEEIRYMAEQEKRDYRIQIEESKQQILSSIIPEESTDKNDIVLEVSQGVGGQEAMLFAAELFDMYRGLAKFKGWEFVENVYDDDTITGGIRNASASIKGESVYKFFKFESGVHRVQRVPATESKGRVHTSTVTVAVLPQPTEVPRIVVYCQKERSQIQNKVIAMNQLRTKVYAHHLKAQVLEYKAQRKLQVGSADRSEKIRTYNFNQDRITDHRLQENLFNIDTFFKGGEDLDFLNGKLQEAAREDIVEEILEQFEKKDLKKVSKIK
ncbi:peptide chain release factor 1-like, mitochondrial [Mizuhopecten yessoensis]|uniref:peptide chain release factor 1-like, mitochondrial n=1 Tax=Mizuhopecten yessoensis TaxID=6573 RepID=UPI000B45C0C9|nr:peptide chain release factor 1-like, mitochondrial [Mizuhopecten yessoensis]